MKKVAMKGLTNHNVVIGKTRYGMTNIQEQTNPSAGLAILKAKKV